MNGMPNWNRAIVPVSWELLRELLHFPSDTKFISCYAFTPRPNNSLDGVYLVVEHPDIPESPMHTYREIMPVIRHAPESDTLESWDGSQSTKE